MCPVCARINLIRRKKELAAAAAAAAAASGTSPLSATRTAVVPKEK